MIYFIATMISIVLFIVCAIAVVINLRVFNTQSKNPWDEAVYEPNQLVEENNITGNRNRIFKNLQDSNGVVDHYIISEDERKPYLLCHFLSELDSESTIQITCFNGKQQPIGIKWIKHDQSLNRLPVIPLPQKTKFVSLDIVEKTAFDIPVVMNDKSIKTYHKIVIWLSVALFFIFIPIGYFSLQKLSGEEFSAMLNVRTLSLGLTMMVFTSVIHYILLQSWFRKHSK